MSRERATPLLSDPRLPKHMLTQPGQDVIDAGQINRIALDGRPVDILVAGEGGGGAVARFEEGWLALGPVQQQVAEARLCDDKMQRQDATTKYDGLTPRPTVEKKVYGANFMPLNQTAGDGRKSQPVGQAWSTFLLCWLAC